ncbi:Helix-turn-helix domain-containing protein [Paracoccus seriniphilus]|uniref:Helix-turn-helix domain-containing protein n=2 Tax=Paracoccus seriniphilus TaxID=184748 RepID=A0A239PMA9_9RHOB|nr:helix-turn-helix transcriptional regulator [Paracoccus seriniphilus]SNT68922.1 Helix-turn-helix domain-containing protein [Paracoccus seriniphilus]
MDQDEYGEGQATLGDRLTAAREGAGLDLGALAERLGVRIETLEGWEADQAEPRAAFLGRLSGMLGVSLVWLMTGEGEGPQDGDGLRQMLRSELRDLQRTLEESAQRIERLERLLGQE